jgi:rhodanese-related sulfurtransferase
MFKEKLNIHVNNGIPEVLPQNLKDHLKSVRIIDVRRPEEFIGELGHIEGAELVTLGPALIQYLEKSSRDEEIVFVCRSGGRSGQATQISKDLGYSNTANMVGGMLRWNELKYSTVRE